MRRIALCTLFLTMAITPAVSYGDSDKQEQSKDLISRGESVIEQMVSVNFKPIHAFVLHEDRLGQVRRYPAVAVRLNEESYGDNEGGELLLGAKVEVGTFRASARGSHFTFFMIGGRGKFAATPVSLWSKRKLRENAKTSQQLQLELTRLQKEMKKISGDATIIEVELRELRERASNIAGIDNIVDLKVELAKLQGYGAESVVERDRLKSLVELGREMPDPEDAKKWRFELSNDLKETAQATAMADRLNTRRREAARAMLRKRLVDIQETRNQNPEPLAKEVLRLRKKRRELEGRLNIKSSAERSDEF